MAYTKRHDNRKMDETRPIEAKVGVIKRAHGSAYFKIGDTIAYAAVYGPRELHPKFMQNPERGILRVKYNMLPFSGQGDRVRPGPNRRSKEIALVTQHALEPVLNLEDFPNSVVDVLIEFPQTDAGSRCAGICAASMALADAGITMKDLVPSIGIGRVGKQMLVDLDYYEEAYEEESVADIPLAMIPTTEEFTLLQMDGDVTKEQLKEALILGKKACHNIKKVMTTAIKQKFQEGVKKK
ncbi:exosome complex exonuclease Rrp41 [Candidatus Woesearchaeota archaeon]|nr:exosome complex exonuclease Rrp41 [Candidatus Woesearchaeota archaeon]